MSVLRKNLFGSAAAFAVLVAAPSSAFAFGEVTWKWHKLVDEHVDIDIDINAEFDPSGMTEIEKLQIQIGDVNAKSKVHGIHNNRPDDGAGVGMFSETFTINTETDQVNGLNGPTRSTLLPRSRRTGSQRRSTVVLSMKSTVLAEWTRLS